LILLTQVSWIKRPFKGFQKLKALLTNRAFFLNKKQKRSRIKYV